MINLLYNTEIMQVKDIPKFCAQNCSSMHRLSKLDELLVFASAGHWCISDGWRGMP